MEYTLKMTVSPTTQQDVYAARVFIAIDEDDRHVETVQIWEANIVTPDPDSRADARIWAARLLQDIYSDLHHDAFTSHIAGKGKSMLELSEPKQPFLL